MEGWNPENDKVLAAPFSAATPPARIENRAAFLKTVGLDAGNPRAAFVCFTEASDGAGLDSLFGALDRLFVEDVRVALLGPVRPEHTIPLEMARRKYQGRFMQMEAFEEPLARQALAGADFLLIPGPVEPQTVWLKRGLLYGAIPVAAQCGGLFQLVRDGEEGFVFYRPTSDALLDTCRRAMNAPRELLRTRCLAKDFSPAAVAKGYSALYENLVGPAQKAA